MSELMHSGNSEYFGSSVQAAWQEERSQFMWPFTFPHCKYIPPPTYGLPYQWPCSFEEAQPILRVPPYQSFLIQKDSEQ